MESVTLTTPEVTPAITTTDYRVSLLVLDVEGAHIVIHLRGTNGERHEYRYDDPDATPLLVALNKANLSVKSLQRRVLERLIADGKLAGSIAGSPD